MISYIRNQTRLLLYLILNPHFDPDGLHSFHSNFIFRYTMA